MSESVKSAILAKFQQFTKEKEDSSKVENGATVAPEFGNKNQQGKRRFGNQRKQPLKGPFESIPEKEVGITEYVSPSIGFSGIIKHRFSDFQVHEIDLGGNVVILDSTELPENPAEDLEDVDLSALTEDQWTELEKIMNSEGNDKLSIDVTEMNKDQRTAIHKAIKRTYGARVHSNSVKEDDRTFIKVGKVTNLHGDRDRISWPKNQGRFLHFTVFKENLDTSHLVSLLSRNLRTKPNLISIAGTKDKRAKTTQRMCVKNKRAEVVKGSKMFKAYFGNYSYQHSPLRLGDLSGNKFTLAVRNVVESDDVINDSLTRIKSQGFINYFGLQRFGTVATMPTHWVGKLMLLEDWPAAVNAILMPKENIAPDVQEACQTWSRTKNAALALKILGKKCESSIEGKILSALKKQPNNYYDALFAIPRNSLLLYLHAYQSYIWNKVISRRIREFGLKTLPGDLVIVETMEETKADDKPAFTKTSNGAVGDDKVDQDNSDSEEIESPDNKPDIRVEKVRRLTEEEACSTPLTDVVYPLPGNDIVFPGNDVEKYFGEEMNEDGISLDTFANSRKEFAMFGKYRKILTTARDLEWKIVKYQDTEADLILSDLDKLRGKTLPESLKDADYKAVIMDFSLNSSTYATMLLREVTKCETSVAYHAKLTLEQHQAPSRANGDDEPPVKKERIADSEPLNKIVEGGE